MIVMIDEKKLIKELQDISKKFESKDKIYGDVNYAGERCIAKIIELIDRQQKIGEWIPCDKGNLPEERVLCCNERSCFIGYVYEDEMSDTGFSASDHREYCLLNVTAWQPLPDVYKA